MRRTPVLIALALLAGLWLWLQAGSGPTPLEPTPSAPAGGRAVGQLQAGQRDLPAWLPAEARPVLAAIESGSPHAYPQDGGVFQNRERLLPPRPRGHYREYTVDTPGSRDRGARRIVTGGDPPSEYWYTADHYRSFRAFDVEAPR
ncbi:ribonuclease domain-containing protein [Lysobacter sp. A3-1-A15]|uniref:ribonuclease domain-containing protein n=1 Tax=Novilysobacter viscosus TaxID=3098602 RepID=UPI002ED9DA73